MGIRYFCFFVTCFLVLSTLFAQEQGVRVGPGKAVEAITKDGGFSLSEKAIKTIEVQVRIVDASTFEIPNDALVFYGVKVGVYRRREGMFHLIPVEIKKKSSSSYLVFSSEVRAKDEVAIAGVNLLRVSEMDAFGGEE